MAAPAIRTPGTRSASTIPLLGVVDELRVPSRYIGIGERVDDLRRFDPEAFCDVLFRPEPDENNEAED